ncbi:FUSC family protein [Streptomyces stramineus]
MTSGAHAYWAVLSCWTIYVGTSTTGEILVKGFRRTTGTLAGILAALAAAGLTTGHPTATMTLIVAGVLGIAATAQLSHAAMAFFVTATIALALPLLSTPTSHALTDRVLETTVGAVCGILAGHLVWPVPTAATADARLRDALTRLRQVVDAALRPGTTAPVDAARQLDQALADLRTTAQPLTYGATPGADAAAPSTTSPDCWTSAPPKPSTSPPSPQSCPSPIRPPATRPHASRQPFRG